MLIEIGGSAREGITHFYITVYFNTKLQTAHTPFRKKHMDT